MNHLFPNHIKIFPQRFYDINKINGFLLFFFIVQHSYSGKALDIWALGATLYAFVYGNVPFHAVSVPAVYDKIKNEKLCFPEQPTISSELRDLIEKMLIKDPAKRITLPQIKVSFCCKFNYMVFDICSTQIINENE